MTVDIDDALLEQARALAAIEDINALINAALEALIEKAVLEQTPN
ncbi:MAG: type II toxin-antitoxin system VapB family antitoxin [Chloracidobacterium sp.]|nr:type II toxin-antitoxin system VapB family antitoxin [Chloracidobacterium sp.]